MARKNISTEALMERVRQGGQNVSSEQILSLWDSPVKLSPEDLDVSKDSKQNIANTINERASLVGGPTEIEIEKLCPSKFNFFAQYSEEKMQELVSSIETIGLQEPLIVRPAKCSKQNEYPDGSYEIIAGHNRYYACQKLGHKTVKCNIIEVDDVTATLIVAQSNIKRDTITIFELAKQYRATYEAHKQDVSENFKGPKNEGFSPKGQNGLLGEGGRTTIAFVSEKYGIAETTMKRKIRLAYLIPKLENAYLKKHITEKQLVDLSYASEYSQELFYERYFSSTDKNWVNDAMTEKMYEMAKQSKGMVSLSMIQTGVDPIKNQVAAPVKKPKLSFSTESTQLIPKAVKRKDHNAYFELALQFYTYYLEQNSPDEEILEEGRKLLG